MPEINQTLIIILVTGMVSYLGWQNQALQERLIFWPPAIKQGQYERFITHGFIHADGMHLLFNMFTFYFFGRIIEEFYRQYLGGAGFVLFYLAAIVVAIIPSYLQNKDNKQYASLGASGAVTAVLFAYILFAPWQLLYIFGIIPIPSIVFAVVYIVTIVLEPRMIQIFWYQLMNPGWFS